MSRLALFLFGAPRIERAGQPVALDTRKAIALLAYLALTEKPHRRDTLAALLWPEYDQEHARSTLRRTLSALNKALDGACLVADRETIAFQPPADVLLDAREFQRLIAACQTHGHPERDVCAACLDLLADATRLYQDDFMAGFSLRDSPAFDDWQLLQREELRRQLARSLERLTRGHIASGEYDRAIEYATRWLALDRLHEPAHRFLMRLYAWSGRRGAALRQYQDCVRILKRELGVSPLDVTTRLSEAINENRLPPPPPPTTASPAPPTHTAARADTSKGRGASVEPLALPAQEEFPLVGRRAEWAALVDAYMACGRGGRLLALEGEAGIGKTRLADELIAYVRRQGALVVASRCYEGEADLAYAPLAPLLRALLMSPECVGALADLPDQWLSEAARLAPDVAQLRNGLSEAPPLDSPGAQTRFFEGLRSVLLTVCREAKPGILFLDDAQWADAATLDVLAYLARRLHEKPLCLLLARRTEEGTNRQRLNRLFMETQRAGHLTLFTLSRLGENDVRSLLASGRREAHDAETARRVYQETEGNPFFVIEYLRALGTGALTEEQSSWKMPGGVRDLLRSRLDVVSDIGAQILAAAAVIGRWFDFDTVRAVSGRDEDETISALEGLAAHGLIRELERSETSAPAYDFTHDKLRSLVYEETSLARRRLLHRRAAGALVDDLRRSRDGGDTLYQIARHFQLAGRDAEAAEYYWRAGIRAKGLYANVEALAHLRAALALGYPETTESLEAIGDLHTILGDYADALDSYIAARAVAAPEATVRLDCVIGEVLARRGEWEQAERRFEAAAQRLEGLHETSEQARLYADWSLLAYRQGRQDQSRELALRARAVAAATGDGRALAQTYNILGVLASKQGDSTVAVEYLRRSLALAEETRDLSAQAAALNNLALAHASDGAMEEAIARATAALELCAIQGDRHHEAALHSNVADLLHATGQLDAAMLHLKQAVKIFSEIGVEQGAVRPEIWKLTEW